MFVALRRLFAGLHHALMLKADGLVGFQSMLILVRPQGLNSDLCGLHMRLHRCLSASSSFLFRRVLKSFFRASQVFWKSSRDLGRRYRGVQGCSELHKEKTFIVHLVNSN